MERSIELSEKYGNFTIVPDDIQRGRTNDAWQRVITSYIKSPFFVWVVLILIMNRKNWKRPIMLLLIVHWLFRSTGDLLNKSMDISPGFTPKNMYIGCAYANVFWSVGEIIGDWYPLLRTKAIVNDKRKARIVFLTCGIYNFTKVCSIAFYFIEVPILLYSTDPNVGTQYNLRWWSVVAAIQAASFLYDLSVILCLKQNLFNQLKYYKSSVKNTFVEKFKKISEFRILISMSATLLFLPLIIVFIFFIIKSIRDNDGTTLATENIELTRRAIIDINFNLIYIDQILLRYYVDTKNSSKTLNTSSKSKFSESKTYHELSSYNTMHASNNALRNNSNNDNNSYGSNGMDQNIINIESLPPVYNNNNNNYKPIYNNNLNKENYESYLFNNNNNNYNNNNQNENLLYSRNHIRHPSNIRMNDYY